ncbi:MAG: hypothetical protein HYT83_03800, partial [Candidatus Levybacteria bacterium]|nr:hypothetical protein [Candidatus Levybacteria bacterium]
INTLFNELPAHIETTIPGGKQRFILLRDGSIVVNAYYDTPSQTQPKTFRVVVFNHQQGRRVASFLVGADGLIEISLNGDLLTLESIAKGKDQCEVVYENSDGTLKSPEQRLKDAANPMTDWLTKVRKQGHLSPLPVSLVKKS